MAIDYEAELNEQQLEAVRTVSGPVLILAGAGSGKTRTITYKIAYLLERGLARPDQVLAVTFTNKAANEMRTRVSSLLGGLATPPLISTFHSFGVRVLRRHAALLGYRTDFTICDVDDQKRVLKQVYQEVSLKDEDLPMEKARAVISRAKNRGWSPEDYLEKSEDFDARDIHGIFVHYQQTLRRANAADFDDLILLTVRLFKERPELCNRFSERYQNLLIDEYQDTNPPQYELIRLLTTRHKNLSAVGDEDQAIYGFRGADIQNILRFESDFPGARIIKLEQNYRSCQTILDAATALVSNNIHRKEKTLWTRLPKGDPITVFVAEDAASEAQFVGQQILLHLREGLRGIAVLYRTNFQSRQFEEVFRRLGIPYKLVGSVSFYRRKEVRDALAYLRLVLNHNDDVSLTRILNEPPRGIGQITRGRILRLASEESISAWDAIGKILEDRSLGGRAHAVLKAFVDLIDRCSEMVDSPLHVALEKILDTCGYMEHLREEGSEESSSRILNIQELITVAREQGGSRESWQEFLDEAALHAEIDEVDENAEVTLMTLHNAKGLEFPVVFLAGCEEGLFPHSRSVAENDIEEERRLCYVGLTRAQKHLYLSYSRRRRFYGRDSDEINQPSRFLQEIPPQLIESRYAPGFFGGRSHAEPVFLRAASLESRVSAQKPKPRKPFAGTSYDSAESMKRALAERFPAKTRNKELVEGAIIVHEKFGKGRILKIEPAGDDLKVTVQFPTYGTKKLLQSYARLKPA
ncbi:MAG: UvrD-helicase domain-containing protein [Acidobacteriota bacterium]|jgi:DNA helicase II / ATP-dependent DNA helicase PcrA